MRPCRTCCTVASFVTSEESHHDHAVRSSTRSESCSPIRYRPARARPRISLRSRGVHSLRLTQPCGFRKFMSLLQQRELPHVAQGEIPLLMGALILQSRLWLGLQLGIVVLQERPNLVRHVEKLRPLLLVERDRKTTQPVDRDASLLAHLHGDGPAGTRFQRLILGLETLQFRFHLLLIHSEPSNHRVFSVPAGGQERSDAQEGRALLRQGMVPGGASGERDSRSTVDADAGTWDLRRGSPAT